MILENKTQKYNQLIMECNVKSAEQVEFINLFCEDNIDFIVQNSLKVLENKTENREAIFYAFRIKTKRERYIQARICSIRLVDLNDNEASWFIEQADMVGVPTEPDGVCKFPLLTTPFYRDNYSFISDVVSEMRDND